ncbi:MAG TPA: Cof-type HAD-IIB family hydrolase [Bacillales bacterium]|nr:Cof-type HAD-IIB family hydrolase [Bacillales bacterium]
MDQPYLFAVDLDGTLLTGEKTISTKTKNALLTAKKAGHKVVIATGRPFRASEAYYQMLDLDTPIVNFNGAFVHHPLDRDWGVIHQPIPLDIAKTVIETCEAFRVKNIIVEVIDDVYLKTHDAFFIEAFGEGDPTFHTGNLGTLVKDDPTSIVVYPEEKSATDLRELLSEAHAEVIEQRSWGAPYHLVEIVRGGVNKAVGLQRVAAALGIPRERVVAFGDEDNDMEMIAWAGRGVAMENAIEPLKAAADYVTGSNEEDGIAHYINRFL